MRTTRARTQANNHDSKYWELQEDHNPRASLSSDSDFVEEQPKAPRRLAKRKRRVQKDTDTEDEYHDNEETIVLDTPISSILLSNHPSNFHVVQNIQAVRTALLYWFAGVHEKRGMPWRKVYDASFDREGRAQRAYEVWISEIMLQQTQVVTVIPYYNRWMAKFPMIKDLAASDIETVNGLWKGLGYYSRAARLLSGAKKLVESYNGMLPDNAHDMMAHVPGIGRYSAGAICSIAYNQCEPVLDGNVNRLLSRVLALHANPKAKSTLDILWAGASDMVQGSERPGDINQALIELGSTVCKVRGPACRTCPLKTHCRAYEETQGTKDTKTDIEDLCMICEPAPLGSDTGVTKYPMKCMRKKAREELDVVNVIEWTSDISSSSTLNSNTNDRFFLLVKRPEKGLLAGLHEFPTVPDVGTDGSPTQMKKMASEMLNSLFVDPPKKEGKSGRRQLEMNAESGKTSSSSQSLQSTIRIVHIKPAGDVIHVFSHIKKTYRVQWVLLLGGGPDAPELRKQCTLPFTSDSAPSYRPKKVKKIKVDTKILQEPSADLTGLKATPTLRWVKENEVVDANIGTGVLKVWNKAQVLWAKS